MNTPSSRPARALSVVVGLALLGLSACTSDRALPDTPSAPASDQDVGAPAVPSIDPDDTEAPTHEPTDPPDTEAPTPEPTDPPDTEAPTPEPTDPPDTEAPTPEPTDPPDTEVPVVAPLAIDWNDDDAVVALDNGWHVERCQGDAPLLCVHDGDPLLGVIEAGSYPFDDKLAAILEGEGLDAALAHHVADYHDTFQTDRSEGCGDGYEYVTHDTEQALLAGQPAVRYGFSMILDGVEVERNVIFLAIFDGQLKVITAVANTPESCVHSEEFDDLTPDSLVTFEPYLTSLAAGSVLPPSVALIDGAVVGTDGALDGGLVYFVWQGEKHRIEQPRPMTVADVEQLGLEHGPPATGLVAGEVEGSWFAVVPPDGADAHLHLVVGNTIHAVVVQVLDAQVVRSIPDATASVITRLTVAG